jgi:hypothetical protein
MARFTGIPSLPQSNIDAWQMSVLGALKENVELLTGTRGEADGASRALLKGQVSVAQTATPQFVALSARGSGLTISGAQVPSLADYVSLLRDVQLIANDVARLRATVDTLIQQLRA